MWKKHIKQIILQSISISIYLKYICHLITQESVEHGYNKRTTNYLYASWINKMLLQVSKNYNSSLFEEIHYAYEQLALPKFDA